MSSENYTPTKLDKFVRGLLSVLIVVIIVAVILLPIYFPRFVNTLDSLNPYTFNNQVEHYSIIGDAEFFYSVYLPKLISLMASGVLAVFILIELRNLMTTVVKGNCFVRENAVSLRRIGNFAFIIAFVMLANVIILFSLSALVVAIVFFIGGLFAKVLSRVFAQAVSYKEENDLTI